MVWATMCTRVREGWEVCNKRAKGRKCAALDSPCVCPPRPTELNSYRPRPRNTTGVNLLSDNPADMPKVSDSLQKPCWLANAVPHCAVPPQPPGLVAVLCPTVPCAPGKYGRPPPCAPGVAT